jgi:hypothetical protein
MYLGQTEPFCEPLLFFSINPVCHARVGMLELVMGRTCREGVYYCVVCRVTPAGNVWMHTDAKTHMRRFLRRRHDAGKTTPLFLMRRRSPDLSHALLPNAAPIFSSENVFLRSRGSARPARNDPRTNLTIVNDGVARASIILFRRRVATQSFV